MTYEYVHGRDCSDCGSAPIHPDSKYCRRCAEKNGHKYAFYMIIDRDKARAFLRNEPDPFTDEQIETFFKMLEDLAPDPGTVFLE